MHTCVHRCLSYYFLLARHHLRVKLLVQGIVHFPSLISLEGKLKYCPHQTKGGQKLSWLTGVVKTHRVQSKVAVRYCSPNTVR